jgi:hypothetical protein
MFTGICLQFDKINSAWKPANIDLFDHWLAVLQIFLVNKNSFVIIDLKAVLLVFCSFNLNLKRLVRVREDLANGLVLQDNNSTVSFEMHLHYRLPLIRIDILLLSNCLSMSEILMETQQWIDRAGDLCPFI